MAPALAEPTRQSNETAESLREAGSRKRLRRALSSVDNVSGHMEDHNMGLRSAAGFLKDSQEMEQILGELGGSGELGQVDILQVIKTMEGASDADAIFPLGGFERDFLVDVGEVVDGGAGNESGSVGAASSGVEEREELQRTRLERRLAFLRRRLRMQQARAIGKRTAEIAGIAWARAGGGVGGVRALLRRLDAAALSGGPSVARSAIGNLGGPGTMVGLERASGALRTELNIVEHHLDSDATASSSGAESNDEAVSYSNPYQQPLPMNQRALWRWAKDRAAIASKWSWLQIQIHELEYKIRQHTDLHRQVRANKGPVVFEVSGYAGPLPGEDSAQVDEDETCARVRPLDRSSFRKRRLLQLVGLHNAASRAALPADVRCSCAWPRAGCSVCTGRGLPHRPTPMPFAALAPRARLSRVDASFHPVLSDVADASPSIRAAGLVRDPQWQQRVVRLKMKRQSSALMKAKRISGSGPNQTVLSSGGGVFPDGRISHSDGSSFKKKKLFKSKRGRPPLMANVNAIPRNMGPRYADFVGEDSGAEESPVPSPASRTAGRPRLNSDYDIDNIIIPHSVAANTRLEILRYKEIITPKWRVLDVPAEATPGNNGLLKRKDSEKSNPERDSDEEDVSEQRLLERHQRCEQLERGKYRVLNASGSRRHHPTHSQGGSAMNHVSEGLDESIALNQDVVMGDVDLAVSNIDHNSTTPDAAPEQAEDPETAASEIAPAAMSIDKRRPTLPSVDVNETVRPYSPRAFPLTDDSYAQMLEAMPENHPLEGQSHIEASETDEHRRPSDSNYVTEEETDCSEGAANPGATLEDPNDPEWAVKPIRFDKLHHR